VENQGNAHVQIKGIDVTGRGRPEPDFVINRSAYVLQAGRKEWIVQDGRLANTESLSLDIHTDMSSGTTREIVVPTN
jgi:hypothetical protein